MPVYLDLHIHTSEDPDNLVANYNLDLLISKIEEYTKGADYLISITDHNTINKTTYLKAVNKIKNLLLGVELHIRKYDNAAPYHCHIYFDIEKIEEHIIDDLNSKLDLLYPNKVIQDTAVTIPTLEKVINTFDSYDFVLLPHGGQSHKTFDGAVPNEVRFDNTIERSIYYNQFDGFTARSNSGLEKTQEYFKRLGINEFVNLVTCTDNYNPSKYPESKSADASPFVPTWMLALPTFNGFRLSLSESSRFVYSYNKPDTWSEYIKKVHLKNEQIDIDVNLTSGLNVVIGGSSSGKTLFVDSIYRKIINDFSNSEYKKANFEIDNIEVHNPTGIQPHYIYQNYIIKVIDKKDNDNRIDDIDIIKKVFPEENSIKEEVAKGLRDLRADLAKLILSVKQIENTQNELKRISKLSHLIITEEVKENILKGLLPNPDTITRIEFSKSKFENHIETLDEIELFLKNNPLIQHNPSLIDQLKVELLIAYSAATFEKTVRNIVDLEKKSIDYSLLEENREQQSKSQDFQKLLQLTASYAISYKSFVESIKTISQYKIECETKEIESMGHKLFIKNDFTLNKEEFLRVINHLLKPAYTINDFDRLEPENLFEDRFKKQSPKVQDYEDFELKIYAEFEKLNRKSYQIIANDGRNFDNLSAGWKTSILLDLILGYEGDMAPLIIDQPEDNLATRYINEGLIKAIKNIKAKKQIILVSHNATIPMLGDAQNIILCENKGNKITIRSNRLEGFIGDKSTVDHIAEITDGGKSSIKKRVKKYNLKNFKG